MKRILSACIEQTLIFDYTNDCNPQKDLELYLSKMALAEKFQIIDKTVMADGTIILKIKKGYNNYSTEGYID